MAEDLTTAEAPVETPQQGGTPDKTTASDTTSPKYKLWDKLNSAKYYTKSYDEFNKQFSNPKAIGALHDALSKAQYYTKSADDFQQQFFTPEKKSSNSTKDFSHGYQATPQDIQQKNALKAVQTGSEKLQNGSNPFPSPEKHKLEFDQNILNQFKKQRQKDIIEAPIMGTSFNVKSQAKADAQAQKDAKEQAEYDKIPLVDKVKSISNSIVGGSKEILKGAVRQASNILKYPFNEKDPTGKSIQNSLDAAAKDINENYLDKGANAASFDMPQREKDLLNSKGVAGALNGFVSFLPALATAERTGGTSVFFQDYENKYENIDSLDKKNNLNLTEGQKQVYANIGALTTTLTMTHGLGSFLKSIGVGEKVEKDILDKASQDVINDLAKSGAEPTAANVHKAINLKLDNLLSRAQKFGISAIKSTPTSVGDMAAMEALNIGTEKLINTATGKKVFDQDNLPERMANAVKNGLGLHIAGSLIRAPFALASGTDHLNSVVNNLYKDPSETNKEAVKQGLAQHLTENDAHPDDIQKSTAKVDEIHNIVKDLPTGLSDKEVAKRVEDGLNTNQLKTDLGKQIADKDEQIKSFSEKSDDPVKNAENEINLPLVKKEREDLNNQLKSIILKQKSNEKGTTKSEGGTQENGRPGQQVDERPIVNEKGEEKGSRIEQEPNEEGRQNDVSDTGAENAPQLQVGDEVQWTNQGVDQFDKPRKITGVSDDGKYAFVEGSNTGIPIEELNKPKTGEQQDAVQEQSTGKVDVQPTPGNGEKVGEGDTEPKVTPEKGEEKAPQEEKPIGISKERTKQQREERGLEDIPAPERTTLKQMFDEGKRAIESGEVKPNEIATEVANKERPLSSTEVNALLADRRRLTDQSEDIRDEMDKLDPEKDAIQIMALQKQHDYIMDQLHINEQAVRNGARENSLAMNSMRSMINNDYSHAMQESRMRTAAGGTLTPEMKQELNRYSEELKQAKKELEDFKNKEAERIAKEQHAKEIKKQSRGKIIGDLKSERKTLIQDMKAAIMKATKEAPLSSDIPYRRQLVAAAPYMKKLTTNLIKEGVVRFEDIVDKIHDEVKDVIEGVTKKDIVDVLAGVHDEQKQTKSDLFKQKNAIVRMAKLTKRLEDLRNGLETETKEKNIVTKRKDIADLEEQVAQLEKETGVTQQKNRQQYIKRLNSDIESLDEQIKKGEKEKRDKSDKYAGDAEIDKLREQRESKKQQLDDLEPKLTDEEKLQKSLQKRLDKINEAISKGEYEPPKSRYDIPVKTSKTVALEAKVRRAENNFDKMAERLDDHKKSRLQKVLEKYREIHLFNLLSGVSTMAKLASYSAWKMGTNFADEVANGINSKTPFLNKIIEKSPRYSGGLNLKDEAKAVVNMWNLATVKDVFNTVKTGSNELDMAYGKKGVDKEFRDNPTLLHIFNALHSGLKTPLQRSEFFRSFEKRLRYYGKKENIHDPNVQFKVSFEAFADSQRVKLMNDNMINDVFYKGGLQRLENQKEFPKTGKALAAAIRARYPITKIITNYALGTWDRMTGAIPGISRATPLVWKAIADGVESLSNEEADSIARILSKGQVGLAAMMVAYYAPNIIQMGGFYGGKRKEGDLKPHEIRVAGVTSPSNLNHSDVFDAMNFAATIRRAQEAAVEKGKEDGTLAGVGQGAMGLAEEIPFTNISDYKTDLTSSNKVGKGIGQILKGMVEPRIAEEVAKKMDDKERDPQTFLQVLESGLPGLRNRVPEKQTELDKKMSVVTDKYGDKQNLSKSDIKDRKEIYNEYLKKNSETITNEFNKEWKRIVNKKYGDKIDFWHKLGRSDEWIKNKLDEFKKPLLEKELQETALAYSEHKIHSQIKEKPKKNNYTIK